MQKPTVQIKDAKIINHNFWGGTSEPRLHGIVIDYPDEHKAYPDCLENGEEIITSLIKEVRGNEVETTRTIYKVLNWKP